MSLEWGIFVAPASADGVNATFRPSTQGATMIHRATLVRIGLFGALVLSSAFAAGWKWG
jgi:hypothetical protein